jgi:hypothetical protein
MTTSVDLGSKTVADCNVNITSPLFNFVKTPRAFFAGSNAAGYFLEEADHRTVEECAQLCIDDAGCKAFDAGNPGLFQAGDCFLSYDSRETLRADDVRAIDQLDLYEKTEIEPILDRFFTQQEGCYIKENDQGGLYEVRGWLLGASLVSHLSTVFLYFLAVFRKWSHAHFSVGTRLLSPGHLLAGDVRTALPE